MKKLSLMNCGLAVLLGILLGYSLPARAANEQFFRQYLDAAEKVLNFTGTAMVARNGKIIHEQGCGRADFAADRRNLPDTRFAIGSVTKQFTATAILQLQEKGLLSLDDHLSKYFDDFPDDVAEKITIRHLLTHTSGVVNFTNIPVYGMWKNSRVPIETQISTIASLPLEFEPGTKFSYSNSGYKILEAIVGKVSGKPWSEYVTENILIPAGMTESGCDLAKVDEKMQALGYMFDEDKRPKRVDLPDASLAGGAGAMFSTVGDLLKWDQALYGDKILKQASKDSMYTPFLANYGYGWMIDSVGSYQRYWHDGLIDGFTTMFIRVPSEKLCVAVLANNHQIDVRRIAQNLTAIALGQPYDVPILKSPAEVDTSKFADYVGVYDLGSGQYRVIGMEKGKLFSQRSSGPQLAIYPEAPDKFYYDANNATTVTFLRDETGTVIAQMMHQDGVDTRCEKMLAEDADKILSRFAPVKVDPAVYDRYVGRYPFSPAFAITVERKGDQIFIQATGQSQFEIFPKSETRYFLKVVDAEIEFVPGPDGKADSLVLYQGGIEQKAPREK